MKSPESLNMVTWSCIHFEYRFDTGPVGAALDQQGIVMLAVDVSDVHSQHELLAAVAKEMHFPSYFGMNWDALEECLRDMEWLPAKGYVLLIREARRLWDLDSVAVGKLVEVWLAAAEEWSKDNVPFHLIFVW